MRHNKHCSESFPNTVIQTTSSKNIYEEKLSFQNVLTSLYTIVKFYDCIVGTMNSRIVRPKALFKLNVNINFYIVFIMMEMQIWSSLLAQCKIWCKC